MSETVGQSGVCDGCALCLRQSWAIILRTCCGGSIGACDCSDLLCWIALLIGAVQQKPSRQQAVPQANDRILLLTEHRLRQILSGEKIAEVRRGRTSSGGAWLGCGGLIYAWVEFGEAPA